MGSNETFQKDSYISKSNNEILQDKLEYLCKSNGIILVMQEESYTLKASFWDKSKEYHFNDKRIHRGSIELLMRIVVDTSILYDRVEVDTQ